MDNKQVLSDLYIILKNAHQKQFEQDVVSEWATNELKEKRRIIF